MAENGFARQCCPGPSRPAIMGVEAFIVWFCGGREHVLSIPWNVAVVLAQEVPATCMKTGAGGFPRNTARHAPG